LRKIIEPYSEVQIDFIAQQIGLPFDRVLQKLSEMILDEKIAGTLDQGRDCLIIFEQGESVEVFEHTLDIFKNLDTVIDSLYDKTQKFKEKYHQ
jgi:26S proteasome regulatory subunit N6